MTNRINPESTTDEESVPTLIEQLRSIDPASTSAQTDVTTLVRDIAPTNRLTTIVPELVADHLALVPLVIAAPFGMTSADHVANVIGERVDSLAALVNGCVERGTFAFDIGPMLAAAIMRVAPDVDAATVAESAPVAPRENGERRNRRNVERDWSVISNRATFYTPGRGDVASQPVLVTLRDGAPAFHSSDPSGERRTFSTITPAMAFADGWGDAANGWGNPFRTMTDGNGARLGDVIPTVVVNTPE